MSDNDCDCAGHRVRAEDLTVDHADFMAVDGWLARDSDYRFNAERAWAEYQERPELWSNLAAAMTQMDGRPWDAVDAIVASVGPWWIPEPTEAPE